jgi:hypothetical protein
MAHPVASNMQSVAVATPTDALGHNAAKAAIIKSLNASRCIVAIEERSMGYDVKLWALHIVAKCQRSTAI